MLNSLSYHQKIKDWNLIETSEQLVQYSTVHFVPTDLNLADCRAISKLEIINRASNTASVGITSLAAGSIAKIQHVQDVWFNATHPESSISDSDRAHAINQYHKLSAIIKAFLNTDLQRNGEGDATLFGLPIGDARLSHGQRVLLQLSIAIYSQEAALRDLIIVLDEPENHLHPSVIIETVDRILSCVSNGQVWIATHSISLLAHFDPSSIWYVEDGKVTHGGKIPEKVLSSLVGDESQVSKLQDFISLPFQFATARYAFESLFEPDAVITGFKDPQSIQIRKNLLDISKNGRLRVLDYGAGKGRLISNLGDLDNESHQRLVQQLDYIAFDKYNDDKAACEEALVKTYGSSEKRYYNDMNQLLCDYDKDSFDVVIMTNVLHEIDAKEWLKLFKQEGEISALVKDDGMLLLVEDQLIPIGEKAHANGFLVLDTPHIKELFGITEKDIRFIYHDQRGDGRLKAHHIPKDCLIRISDATRLKAVKSVSATSREKILSIRKQEKTYANGKLHGFWTQQFANSQLTLSELEG